MVRLLEPEGRFAPNVAVLKGLHWAISEEMLVRSLPLAVGSTITSCRCFIDQSCGASLGVFLVEFNSLAALYSFASQDYMIGNNRAVPHLLHMTDLRWDRSGRLPDLPQTILTTYDKAVEGFGREGFAMRGVGLCIPNTLTEEGAEAMDVIRKRLRAE